MFRPLPRVHRSKQAIGDLLESLLSKSWAIIPRSSRSVIYASWQGEALDEAILMDLSFCVQPPYHLAVQEPLNNSAVVMSWKGQDSYHNLYVTIPQVLPGLEYMAHAS